jgi:hypothetical protein
MTANPSHPRNIVLRSLISGILGITLLLPASFFMLTLLARILFGAKTMYYYIAPSFLQSPFDLWAWHKAQFIIGSLLLAIVLNALATLNISLYKKHVYLSLRRNWFNTAIALQGILLLILLLAYTLIQHIRY